MLGDYYRQTAAQDSQLADNVRRALEQQDWQPVAVEETVHACSTCHDLHVITYDVPVTDERFGKLHPCPDCTGGQKLLERRWKMKLRATELPKEYQSLTFETWLNLPDKLLNGKRLAYACAELFMLSENHMISLAEAYQRAGRHLPGADVSRNSMILHGAPGLGKTGLAAAIVNQLIVEGKSVLYIRTQDFIEAVKETFDREKRANDALNASSQEIVGMVKRSPRLVMDEFNMSLTGEWRQEVIESVIRYRYGNGLPTILTCNAGPDDLERQWGERTTSVLFTMAHWIPMGGYTLRDLRQREEAF